VNPEFLTIDDVLKIHEEQLKRFGGHGGLRDQALLESAVAQPRTTFGGEYLHEDLFAMAAAYLFHIVRNHPFVDGNKRTGYIVAFTFLDINGVLIPGSSPTYYEATIQVAEGKLDKTGLAELLRRLATAPS
jgi:death on curing protein